MFYGNNWLPIQKYLVEGDVFDYGECRNISYALTYFYILIAVILFVSALYLLITFIRKDIQIPNQIDCASYYLGLLLGFISVTLIPLSVRNMMMVCYHNIMGDTIDRNLLSWFAILYFIQLYLLWLILFMRLHIATVNGFYQFNKYIIISFKIMFALCPVITTVYSAYLVWYEHHTNNHEYWHLILNICMLSILMIFNLIVPIVLVLLFLHKLMKIYQNINKSRKSLEERQRYDRLIPIITRHSILATISVSITLLTMLSFFVHLVLSTYLLLFNIYCNFISIMFAYKHLKQYYFKICSVIDKKCRKFCFNLVNKDLIQNMNKSKKGQGLDGNKYGLNINVTENENKMLKVATDNDEDNDDGETRENCENDTPISMHSIHYGNGGESMLSKISDIGTETPSTE